MWEIVTVQILLPALLSLVVVGETGRQIPALARRLPHVQVLAMYLLAIPTLAVAGEEQQ